VPENDFKLEKVFRLCRRCRRGVAAVEFAPVAPLLFLMILGMIEFGRMMMVQQIITNPSREGARIAVLDGATTSDILTSVNSLLSNSSIQGAAITVTPDPPSSAGYGEPVTVTVSTPFDQVSWLPWPIFLGGRQTTASTAMRRETIQ